MKKYIMMAMLPFLLLLGACGGGTEASSAPETTTSEAINEPITKPSESQIEVPQIEAKPDLNGTWIPVGKLEVGDFVAQISDNHIVINWVVKEDDFNALYWEGTFPTNDLDKIISKGDTEKMARSMLASMDKQKTFVYKDDQISYSFTISGATQIIHLKRT